MSAMRPPSAGIEEYLKALNKKPEGQAPPSVPPLHQALQSEMQRVQQLQMQKAQLQQQLQMIDSQLLKAQGGIEVLRRMGGLPN